MLLAELDDLAELADLGVQHIAGAQVAPAVGAEAGWGAGLAVVAAPARRSELT